MACSNMDLNRLSSEELSYELRLRGSESDDLDAVGKRKLLRQLLRQEKEGATGRRCVELFDPRDEIVVCAAKLDQLVLDIRGLTTTNWKTGLARVQTKLIHLEGRIKNITASESEEVGNQQWRLRERLETVKLNVDKLRESEGEEVSLLDLPNDEMDEAPSLINVDEVPQPVRRSTLVADEALEEVQRNLSSVSWTMPPVFTVRSRETPVPDPKCIKQLDLTYKGADDSVLTFLQRLEELRESRGISKDRLFRSAVELFTGDALIWYRASRSRFHNWDELVLGLREDFLPADYEEDLWEEIRNRRQRNDESLREFVHSMESLFSRFTRLPSEESRTKIMRRNMCPYLQRALALQEIKGVQELIKLGRVIEDTEKRAASFAPQMEEKKSSSKEKPTLGWSSRLEQASPRKCYQCGKVGHIARYCTRNKVKAVSGNGEQGER